MKVCTLISEAMTFPSNLDDSRCTSLPSQVMYPLKWYNVLLHSSMPVTYCAVPTSVNAPSPNLRSQLHGFMNIEKVFVSMECDQQRSPFHANTQLFTILIKYANSVPQRDSVHPSPSHDTSRLSSDHGDGQIVTTPWGRCCSQTNGLTNSMPHAMNSCINTCSLLPMDPHQNLY